MTDRPLLVTTVAHARAGLSGALRRFRADPEGALPVVLGSHRRAEAVILPYARYESIVMQLLPHGVADDRESLGVLRDAVDASGADQGFGASGAGVDPAGGAGMGPVSRADAISEIDEARVWESLEERDEQINRWLDDLETTLNVGADIVDRSRDVFRMDPALPLACEALATRVGELARLLVEADSDRFEDPMWSLAARTRAVVIRQYNRVDEQALWMLAAEGFPEIADLAAQAREPH